MTTATGPAPGQLQGALVGFCARVGEEDLTAGLAGTAIDKAIDGQRHLGRQCVAVQIGDVGQCAGLLGYGIGHGRVGVPERHHGQSGDEVEIALTGGVVEHGALAAHEGGGGLGVGTHEGATVRRGV